MAPILYALIGTADMTRANAFAKIKVIKQVLRSVKQILWPTDGREDNVLDAVRLAVFRMTRSAAVFNTSRNFTRQPDSAESTCNETAVSADATKSDNVEGSNVEKNEDERVIPNLASMQKSVLRGECSQKLNDSVGILGIDSKGKVAVGTTSGTVLGSLPNNDELNFYVNAAIPIGQRLPITRFNLLENAIFKACEKNTSPQNAMKEEILSKVLDDFNYVVVVNEIGKPEFFTKVGRTIWYRTNGKTFTYCIDDIEFTEKL